MRDSVPISVHRKYATLNRPWVAPTRSTDLGVDVFFRLILLHLVQGWARDIHKSFLDQSSLCDETFNQRYTEHRRGQSTG